MIIRVIVEKHQLNMKNVKNLHATVSLPVFDYVTIVMSFFFMVAFNGWSSWSGWSLCNSNGERNRSRKCLRETPDSSECQGNEREVRSCKSFPSNGESRLHIMKNRMS